MYHPNMGVECLSITGYCESLYSLHCELTFSYIKNSPNYNSCQYYNGIILQFCCLCNMKIITI